MKLAIQIVNASDHDNYENLKPISSYFDQYSPNFSYFVTPYKSAQENFITHKPKVLIYSGRTYQDDPATPEEARRWYGWLTNIDTPTITICGAYQRWIISQGGHLTTGNPENDLIKTYLSEDRTGTILEKYTARHTFILNHHRYFIDIKSLPASVRVIGRTVGGLSIVKHRAKPIYGFQGHPEKAFGNHLSYREALGRIFADTVFRQISLSTVSSN